MAAIWVVDTNLLVEAVLVRVAESWRSRAQRDPRVGGVLSRLRYLNSKPVIDAFWRLARSRQAVTSMGVAVEIGWVARPFLARTPEARSWDLTGSAFSVAADLRLRVETVDASALDAETVRAHGPADASLVALTRSRTSSGDDAKLLTAERQLALWCEEKRVRFFRFDPAEAFDLLEKHR